MKKNNFRERDRLFENRPPARDISDVELSEDVYKSDFLIGDKYSSFSTEIIRLSLLGIAGYGFIISEILMKYKDISENHFVLSKPSAWLSAVGILFFGLALALSLYHRFRCTSCLYDQILISRSLLRLKNHHWSEWEKEEELKVLASVRTCQKIESKKYHNILGWSSTCLFMGFTSVVLVFFLILKDNF